MVEVATPLGLSPEAWAALREPTRNYITKACLDKVAYSAKAARGIASRHRRDGEVFSPYRCPFDGRHWHVGHPPSMETVMSLADAVRDLHGNLPNPG